MLQLRLTQKFAKDLHITVLTEPRAVASIFDDWVIDVVRVQRKKVAMMVHVKSLLPFFIPYQNVGGAHNISQAFGMLLSGWVIKKGYTKHCRAISELFSQPVTFCKTADRKVLGHMNDFKRCAPFAWQDVGFDNINWEEQTNNLSDMPITMCSQLAFSSPGRLMLDLLERGL
jgi:hypothetical protein